MKAKINLNIMHFGILKMAIRKLNLDLRCNNQSDTSSRRDYQGMVGVIQNNGGKQIACLEKKGNRYLLLPGTEDASDEIKQIKQEYVQIEIMKAVFRNGWTKISHKNINGQYEIVLAV